MNIGNNRKSAVRRSVLNFGLGTSILGCVLINGIKSSIAATETTVVVPANSMCTDSGINVQAGESMNLQSDGRASYGHEGSPVNDTPKTDPDGNRYSQNRRLPKKDDTNAIYPKAIGALVGRVGTNGNYFYIGSTNQITFPRSGRLFLCYNDVQGQYGNNSGAYKVVLSSTTNNSAVARSSPANLIANSSNRGSISEIRQTLLSTSANHLYGTGDNLIIQQYQERTNSDGSIALHLDLFNFERSAGLVEVYDRTGNLKDLKLIEARENNVTDLGGALMSTGATTWNIIFGKYGITDLRATAKETTIDLTVDSTDTVKISRGSDLALLCNEYSAILDIINTSSDSLIPNGGGVNLLKMPKQRQRFVLAFIREAFKDLSKDSIVEAARDAEVFLDTLKQSRSPQTALSRSGKTVSTFLSVAKQYAQEGIENNGIRDAIIKTSISASFSVLDLPGSEALNAAFKVNQLENFFSRFYAANQANKNQKSSFVELKDFSIK